MKNIIFDMDLTLVDTTCLEEARHSQELESRLTVLFLKQQCIQSMDVSPRNN